MEGSCTRSFPRMSLDQPIELEIGERAIRIDDSGNNLSVGGLFVRRADLPVGSPVLVRIFGRQLFEAQGQVCNSQSGAGISFTALSGENRDALEDLIEDLTLRGLPAA